MFRKLAVITAASMMVFASTAHAGSAAALSLRSAPAAHSYAAGPAAVQDDEDRRKRRTILFVLFGAVAIVALLEVTGAINIFGDDSPDSP